MSTFDVSEARGRIARARKASPVWPLTASGLFLGSAVLQLAASLQRWGGNGGAQRSDETAVEDHLFDYAFPTDPWEQIGTTAQLFGAGALLQALAIVAMAFGVWTMPRGAADRRVAIEIVLVTVTAASFGLGGIHALVSGLISTPTPLQHLGALGLLELACLIALGALWSSRAGAAMAACLFLIGSTAVGYLVASFLIAPILAGGMSHDTTPWTETVVAASTAAAAIAMLCAAGAGGSPSSARHEHAAGGR